MRARLSRAITGVALLVLAGCEDPGEIGPVAAPGTNNPRTSPDGDVAQALGESLPSSFEWRAGAGAEDVHGRV